MKLPRPRALVASLSGFALLSFSATCLVPRTALAERVLVKNDDGEVYTEGRVGGFLSYVNGDAAPVARPNEDINGGLWSATQAPQDVNDTSRGNIDMWRVRSGFLANQLALGARGHVTPDVSVSGYIQIWAFVESEQRNKGSANPADVRQGYGKLDSPYGAFSFGRTRTLMSRGATDINVLYAHKWGIGFPNQIDSRGPTQGMVGFGVLGSGFAAGFIYGTPTFAGLQLNVGVFDPATLGGPGWTGTKYPRPETELTFEQKFGESGKVVLFANTGYQKVYKPGQCPNEPCDETVWGVGYGGRFEYGPVHLGAAGHIGKGLGLSYALENSYAVADAEMNLRKSDGYYVQSQVVVDKFDFFAGWGIARIFMTDLDRTPSPAGTALSVIKYQMGINGGVVYNVTPNVHIDLEYFRASAAWFLGEEQTLNCGATGMIFNW
ncbi:MAG: porin [Polyangiaceae bacterium]|nr:porin [Polyangiaceae bacterium]